MKLTELDIKGPNGQGYCIIETMETPDPSRKLILLSLRGEQTDYSLWLAEFGEDGSKMHMWPYEGDDYNEKLEIILQKSVEKSFEK